MIPLFSVRRETEALREELQEAISSVFESCHFIGGEEVDKFEEEFAKFHGGGFCVGLSNGTDALIASLYALGIGEGDEVILPAYTFTATAEAVVLCGAKPVFVDINEDNDYNISVSALDAVLSRNTVAVVAVHLYGVPASMDILEEFCTRNGLALIEDAAQAHGALYKGRKVGTFGNVSCFSFYPTKNLGACGDAGAVITGSEELTRKVRLYINHGRKTHTEHIIVGRNARMDAFQAAVIRVKLRHLNDWNEKRRRNWALLKDNLSELKAFKIRVPEDNITPAWHLFIAETENRDETIEHLRSSGIEAGNHYPHSLVEMEAYKYLGYKEKDFPQATSVASKVISLPVHPFLKDDEKQRIIEVLRGIFG